MSAKSGAQSGSYWCHMDTPVGRLLLAGDATALTRVHFQSGPHPLQPASDWQEDRRPFEHVRMQLEEYFGGTRRTFSVRLAPAGTAFQQAVWQALRAIPYGQTIGYGELARRLGRANGARAVGLANGANPLPIIVPCHRVIAADGSLTGFGGGLPIKRALLALEGAACVSDLFSAQEWPGARAEMPAPPEAAAIGTRIGRQSGP
jgi:methylated-DNA-[protein]-cysteine S-methyltransferase